MNARFDFWNQVVFRPRASAPGVGSSLVFRTLEMSNMIPRVVPKPQLIEAEHLMHCKESWHGPCVSRLSMQIRQSKKADWATSPGGCPQRARDRVFEIACELFAEAGFHGTHFRDICKRTGTNVAGICYHFQSKEGLYQAAMMEAGRRLSAHQEDFVASQRLPAEQRLLALIESLLERLSAKRAWIAKLLARELIGPACGAHTYVASGLERDSVLLQAVMRGLLGAKANSEAIRLHALSVVTECVFYSLAGENLNHPFGPLAVRLPNRALLAHFLTQRTLRALEREGNEPEVANP